jgi:molybdopterin-guanine dinucleotide biosynthesis protein A
VRHDRILAIIQAGGAGGRMDVLTRERAKPALPFAGVYQLVDFPLSNLAHSGITDVWLSRNRAPDPPTRTGSPVGTPTSCFGSVTRSAAPGWTWSSC